MRLESLILPRMGAFAGVSRQAASPRFQSQQLAQLKNPAGDYWEKVDWVKSDEGKMPGPIRLQPEFLSLIRPDARILDVGCGQGRSLRYLAKQGYSNLFGVDFNPTAVSVATTEALKLPTKKRPNFSIAESGRLPYPDNSFDTVMTQAFWNCFVDEAARKQTMAELYRVLKPGGYYYVEEFGYTPEVPAHAARYNAAAKKGMPKGTFEVTNAQGKLMYLSHHYEKDHLERLFRDAGLTGTAIYREVKTQTRSGKPNRAHLFIVRKPLA